MSDSHSDKPATPETGDTVPTPPASQNPYQSALEALSAAKRRKAIEAEQAGIRG